MPSSIAGKTIIITERYMARREEKLDAAARAAWLYYVAGRTQDQIASILGVSRQSAQRLVSTAVAEGLVRVRIDHPISHCMDLARQLKEKFGLASAVITPSDTGSDSTTLGIAEAAAEEIEKTLRQQAPLVIAIGTGRTLKAAIEQLPPMECPQHKIVSLTGNIAPDGSAAYYNVIFTLANLVEKARSFPMPLPVLASSQAEKITLHKQDMIRTTLELAKSPDVTFVGIGDLGPSAPLYQDGFITEEERQALDEAGAVGEIVGWIYDRDGHVIKDGINERVASAPLPSPDTSRVVAVAMGTRKLPGILGALKGRLINELITDEKTAEALLK